MDLGLNIASAGMLAEQVQVDQLSGDLANVSTPGYKPASGEQRSFGALLLSNTATGSRIGTIDSGVEVVKGPTRLTQGALQSTGRPLDFAISGTGFFAVQTPAGVQFTRDGRFSANAQGQLVDAAGDPVLSAARTPIQVGVGGTVAAGVLGVFNLAAPSQLGNNNFSGRILGSGTGTVQSGQLEGSAVVTATTVTSMQADMSSYQAGQQAINTIGQTLAESASTIGLVS